VGDRAAVPGRGRAGQLPGPEPPDQRDSTDGTDVFRHRPPQAVDRRTSGSTDYACVAAGISSGTCPAARCPIASRRQGSPSPRGPESPRIVVLARRFAAAGTHEGTGRKARPRRRVFRPPRPSRHIPPWPVRTGLSRTGAAIPYGRGHEVLGRGHASRWRPRGALPRQLTSRYGLYPLRPLPATAFTRGTGVAARARGQGHLQDDAPAAPSGRRHPCPARRPCREYAQETDISNITRAARIPGRLCGIRLARAAPPRRRRLPGGPRRSPLPWPGLTAGTGAGILKWSRRDTSFGEASSRTQATDPNRRETLRIRTPLPGLRGEAKWLRMRPAGGALRRGVPKLLRERCRCRAERGNGECLSTVSRAMARLRAAGEGRRAMDSDSPGRSRPFPPLSLPVPGTR